MAIPKWHLSKVACAAFLTALCLSLLAPFVLVQSARAVTTTFDTSDNGNGTVTITGCTDACAQSLEIPSSVNGADVTAIGNYAFDTASLTSVSIPDSIKSIGNYAFCRNQLKVIAIPNSVTSIGSSAFSANILTAVTIPDSVVNLGAFAFSDNQLAGVRISNSLTSIGRFAFWNNKLAAVTIPQSVTSIEDGAFEANQLTSLTWSGSVNRIGSEAFKTNQLTSLTIPESVTSLGTYAFADNKLSTLQLSNSITAIPANAFSKNSLSDLVIPNAVTVINDSAFATNSLTSITIPASVTRLGAYVFSANAQLTSATFLGNAPSGGGGTFSVGFAGTSIRSVVVPADAAGFTDDKFEGIAVTRSGSPINPPALTAPAYQSAAKILGEASVGKTLTAKAGTWTGSSNIAYAFQWYACSKAIRSVVKSGQVPSGCRTISKATKSVLKLSPVQRKAYVLAQITATNQVKSVRVFTASTPLVR